MAKKTPKTALGRWRVRINQLRAFYEQRLQEVTQQHDSYRRYAEQLMTTYVGKVRQQGEALTNNNVTITELQNQVAIQARFVAEAKSDAQLVIGRYNDLVQRIKSGPGA